ncbi:DAK2 domain-containing protein, partial [Microbacterium arborescens]
AVAAGAGARTALQHAGDGWADKGGGTSGAIWGEMLLDLGAALGDDDAVDAALLSAGVGRMKDAVMSFGKATVGDKTMIDAIVPFADTLRDRLAQGDALLDAWATAADAAQAAAEATAQLTARLGRARTHGDRSLGTPDPGAVSFALVTRTVLDVLKEDA